MKTKVGLLIDLNSFPRFPKDEDYFNDENNSPLEDGFSTTSSATELLLPLDPKLEAKVKQLQEFILEQLTKDGTIRGKFNCSDFQFTYRYFNSSCYSHPVKELRNYLPFNVPSFEAFEKSLEFEVRNININGSDNSQEANKMTLMSSALKGMVSDFEWDSVSRNPTTTLPRVTSSTSIKSSDSISPLTDSVDESTRNIIYVFFRVPRDIDEMEHFVDDVPEKLDIITSSKHFLNALVSKAFLDMITRTYQMRVNFVDMWTLHEYSDEELRSTNYPNSILKVLRHLHGGQVLHPASNVSIVPGLPAWKVFLKNNLKASSITPMQTSASMRSLDSETTHVSDSSRCSTPVHGVPTKIQALKSVPGSERKDLDSRRAADRIRLRKDVLLKSQSQTSLPLSESSLKTRSDSTRIEKRFSTGSSSQMILVRKTNKPFTFSRDHFPRRKTLEPMDTSASSSSGSYPKKVRRNLFTSSSQEPSEEIRRLLASTAKFNFSRSPSRSGRSGSLPRSLFGSPKAASPLRQPEFKSPGSSSVLKSRRQLDMGHFSGSRSRSGSLSLSPLSTAMGVNYGAVSPVQVLSGLICPESPATPPTKRIKTGSMSISSCEKRDVVQESPEAFYSKNPFGKSRFTRHDSFTFYSGSSSDTMGTKSRAWEESGRKLQAARIKDSVDLSQIAHSSLSLEDLELIDPTGSPLGKETSNVEMPLC